MPIQVGAGGRRLWALQGHLRVRAVSAIAHLGAVFERVQVYRPGWDGGYSSRAVFVESENALVSASSAHGNDVGHAGGGHIEGAPTGDRCPSGG